MKTCSDAANSVDERLPVQFPLCCIRDGFEDKQIVAKEAKDPGSVYRLRTSLQYIQPANMLLK